MNPDRRRLAVFVIWAVSAGSCADRDAIVDEPPRVERAADELPGGAGAADADPLPAALRKPKHVPDGENALPSAYAACDWLSRHQSPDGAWRLRSPGGGCGDRRCSEGEGLPDVVGSTSLAVMALLSAGAGFDGRGVELGAGLARLVSAQSSDGSFDPSLAPHVVLDQALATAALCRALVGTSHPRQAERAWRPAGSRALQRLLALRTPGAAWSDSALGASGDLRVTTWATMAVHAARRADFDIPGDVSRDVLSWLDTDPGGGTGTSAAMRTCCRVLLGATQRDAHLVADRALLEELDSADGSATALSAVERYFVTVAQSWWGGEVWARRRGVKNGAVIPLQLRVDDGCVCGSWVRDGVAGPEGDRVGATALTTMIFAPEFISTYANVMRARGPLVPK